MDPRLGWNQQDSRCLALTTWNTIYKSTKWTIDKGPHDQTPFPSPVITHPIFPQSPQDMIETLNVPINGNQVMVREHSTRIQNIYQNSLPQCDNFPALRDGTQNQNILHSPLETISVEINHNCPVYIHQVQQNRKAVNSRYRKQKEDIENKRRLNKGSVHDRNNDVQCCIHDEESNAIPWKETAKSYSPGFSGLHEEIEDFHQYISPTPTEHRMRSTVVRKIEDLVKGLWPDAKVDVFGSFRTNLYLPTSDIDLVIFGSWTTPPLRELEAALKKKGLAHDIKVLDRAAVPIVKMIDNETDIRVDIGFNITNSVKSAKLITDFIDKFPCLPFLVLVVKQYLLQSNLNEVWTGGISSYSLILMCISFLQLRPHIQPIDPHINLGVLLYEFFELYGIQFNYFQTGIRITDGGSRVKKEEIQQKMDGGHRASFLCIEDPLKPGNDVGRSSFGVLFVKQAFANAFNSLSSALSQDCHNGRPESILSRIIHVSNDLILYRRRINEFLPAPVTSESNESDNDESLTAAIIACPEDSAIQK